MERGRPLVRFTKPTRCPFCHDELRLGEAPLVCAACHAMHHAECLEEHGRCAACGHDRDGDEDAEREDHVDDEGGLEDDGDDLREEDIEEGDEGDVDEGAREASWARAIAFFVASGTGGALGVQVTGAVDGLFVGLVLGAALGWLTLLRR